MTIVILACSIIAVFIILVVLLVKWAMKRENEVRENGLIVEGVIVSSERVVDDGANKYKNKVEYLGNDGERHVAHLNFMGQMRVGMKIKIQYLPGLYDEALYISCDWNQ